MRFATLIFTLKSYACYYFLLFNTILHTRVYTHTHQMFLTRRRRNRIQ